MPVTTLEVPSLGNRAHLVHDGRVAVAVDPPRDVALVERAVEEAGVDLVAVADTHVHNDYVSGALALARRHGADHLLSADEAVDFERLGIRDGDRLQYGGIELEVLATPGHTRHHQSFLARVGAEAPAVFSGGSLLLGTVGRTDLVDPLQALHLAGLQWDSAHRLGRLDPVTRVLPTHGFGSFCAGGTATGSGSGTDEEATISAQLSRNPALTTDRAPYAAALVAGFGPIPGHYPHMDPLNRAGRGARTPHPARPVRASELDETLRRGGWVVDLRDRAAHARGHLPGTVGVEYSDQFATYVGWLVPWGAELTLLADDADVFEAALRDLTRIGIEGPGVHVLEPALPLDARYRRADWAAYREESGRNPAGRPLVVDVRQRDEWAEGHLPGAVHLPVQDVVRSAPALPDGELWVHCRSGYRAGIAASLLHRLGRPVVHVDDGWDRVAELAIETTPAAA